MLISGKSYEDVYSSFRWKIPEYYNIGVDICDKHVVQKDKTALIYETDDGRVRKYTFGDFIKFSNQFANVLTAAGITRGDRVGILLPQCPEIDAPGIRCRATALSFFPAQHCQRRRDAGRRIIRMGEKGAASGDQ